MSNVPAVPLSSLPSVVIDTLYRGADIQTLVHTVPNRQVAPLLRAFSRVERTLSQYGGPSIGFEALIVASRILASRLPRTQGGLRLQAAIAQAPHGRVANAILDPCPIEDLAWTHHALALEQEILRFLQASEHLLDLGDTVLPMEEALAKAIGGTHPRRAARAAIHGGPVRPEHRVLRARARQEARILIKQEQKIQQDLDHASALLPYGTYAIELCPLIQQRAIEEIEGWLYQGGQPETLKGLLKGSDTDFSRRLNRIAQAGRAILAGPNIMVLDFYR